MIPAVKRQIPFEIKRRILSALLRFRRKVDFAIIGFPKCATTSIAQNLLAVPGIALPSYEVQLRDYILGKIDTDNPSRRFGIKNPNLIYEQHNITALVDRNPKIQLLLCLRRPTDWLFSFYQYRKLHIENNNEWIMPYVRTNPELSEINFDDIVYNGKDLIGANVKKGVFSDNIKFLLKYVPASQIHITLLEEIASHPTKAYEKIFTFLNLDPTLMPTVPMKANQNRDLYESKIHFEDHLEYLDRYYQTKNIELNQLLFEKWGIKNSYW